MPGCDDAGVNGTELDPAGADVVGLDTGVQLVQVKLSRLLRRLQNTAECSRLGRVLQYVLTCS